MSDKKQLELCNYLSTVMKMMKERHPGCRFTLMASCEGTERDEDGEPTVNVALASNEGDLDVLIHRLEQIKERIEGERGEADD